MMFPFVTSSPCVFFKPRYLGFDLRLFVEVPAAFFVAHRFNTRETDKDGSPLRDNEKRTRNIKKIKQTNYSYYLVVIITKGKEKMGSD